MSAVGAAAIGAGASLISGAINAGISYGNTERSAKRNFEYGEMAADAADRRTRELYNDIQSPKALLQQYQEAGLSPSLMFSGGGGQGSQPANGAQGSGAQGLQTQTYGIDLGQIAMQAAQIDLMKAEARKANSEADVNQEKPSEIHAHIQEMLANAGVKNAEREAKQFDLYMTKATSEATIETAKENLQLLKKQGELMTYQIISAQAKSEIDSATVKEKIKQIDLQNAALEQQINESISKTKLNEEQANLVRTQVIQTANKIAQDWYALSIEYAKTMTQTEYVHNLKKFQEEQIKLQAERLQHDIHIDWANFGLDIAELIEGVYEFNVGQLTNNIQHILPSGDSITKTAASAAGK